MIEVSDDGASRITIGAYDRGDGAELEPEGMFVWKGGNVVAALRATDTGGVMHLCDLDGVPILRLPHAP